MVDAWAESGEHIACAWIVAHLNRLNNNKADPTNCQSAEYSRRNEIISI